MDLLKYASFPLDNTPVSRFADATAISALATRLHIVQKRWKPVRYTFVKLGADFFREVNLLIYQVKRGKLQPWQPFGQRFELFETENTQYLEHKDAAVSNVARCPKAGSVRLDPSAV